MIFGKVKYLFLCVVLLLTAVTLKAQGDENPVRWTSAVENKGDGLFQVTFTAKIQSPWHMYDIGPYEGGPNATTFTFTPNDKVVLQGPIRQKTTPTHVFDPTFEMKIGYFAGKAEFTQEVRLKSPEETKLRVNVEWMVCNDQSCLPPADVDMTVVLKPSVSAMQSDDATVADSEGVTATDSGDAIAAGTSTSGAIDPKSSEAGVAEGRTFGALEVSADAANGGTLWAAIIEAILWGFAALLTPCVFPMVPMTVSFFMKGSENKAKGRMMAALYGTSIVLLYTLPIAIIILITRVLGGDSVTADIFNWLATHWIPNVIFFLVFMIFAASFFGAFEITMPSWLVNKSDSKADKGGIIGVFFMALTLVLVSFSCTGPIVGSVLIKSTSGEVWAPVITMFAFSLAFSLPFTVLAFFPSFLTKLPKSGGWLNSVKVVLGFIELALGLKFLSVADQTYHWGILDREIYLALWIVIFTLLGLYFLGKLRFAHDNEPGPVTVPRLLLSIITFSFVVYMLPGMWGAPLRGLSGYLPPLHTQDFVVGAENNSDNKVIIGRADGPTAIFTTDQGNFPMAPKYSDFLSLPHGLTGFFDYNEALDYARKVGKPLFVDYTGHGCVNCREMEARVWSDPLVLKLLRDNFVIVALYSDDKKTLPESHWVTTESGKVLKSLGKINSRFAHKQFGINSQPYYMILDGEGRQLVPGRGYNLSVPDFVRFLEDGIRDYQKEQKVQ